MANFHIVDEEQGSNLPCSLANTAVEKPPSPEDAQNPATIKSLSYWLFRVLRRRQGGFFKHALCQPPKVPSIFAALALILTAVLGAAAWYGMNLANSYARESLYWTQLGFCEDHPV